MLDESCCIISNLAGEDKLVGFSGKCCLVDIGWDKASLVVINASESGGNLNG